MTLVVGLGHLRLFDFPPSDVRYSTTSKGGRLAGEAGRSARTGQFRSLAKEARYGLPGEASDPLASRGRILTDSAPSWSIRQDAAVPARRRGDVHCRIGCGDRRRVRLSCPRSVASIVVSRRPSNDEGITSGSPRPREAAASISLWP